MGGRAAWGTGRAARMAVLAVGIVALALVSPVLAGHMTEWRHNHSNEGVPPRPDGLAELRNRFGGSACNERANNARTWFPSAVSRTQGGYVLYHPYLAINVGNNIRNHIAATHRNGALDYGIYGYRCSRCVRGCPGGSPEAIRAGHNVARTATDTDVADVVLAVR
jgi:hypothetical protein